MAAAAVIPSRTRMRVGGAGPLGGPAGPTGTGAPRNAIKLVVNAVSPALRKLSRKLTSKTRIRVPLGAAVSEVGPKTSEPPWPFVSFVAKAPLPGGGGAADSTEVD